MHHLKTATARRPRYVASLCAVITLILVLPIAGGTATAKISAQAPVPMGNAASFGALSAAAMTNSGLDTVVNANVGSSTSISSGVTHPGYAAYVPPSTQLTNAQASLLIAYGNAEAQTPTNDITGVNLAGKTLIPGVYNSTGGILISGPTPLVLNGGGSADSVFIFQAASSGDLTVDPTSNVVYTNGAQPCNVFWKVQSAFLKNTGFTFVGTILALTQITLTDSITVQGRVQARNADVTFIHDTVVVPTSCPTQASLDATAAQAAAAAAQAAADAKTAADAAAKAAADAAAAKAAADAKTAADAAAKAAADAAAAVKAANIKAAQAAAAKAVAAAKVAKAKAAVAKAAAKKAAQVKAARKAAAATSTNRTLARPPIRPFGFTG
jgi:pyruvate/2-oxoglutarate dehydrogenase complex dihydrolipoamide acyltransferase (E2) component